MRRLWLVALVGGALFFSVGPLANSSAAEEPAPTAAPPSPAPDADGEIPSPDPAPADIEYYELYHTLAETIDQVERNYVKKVNRRELMEAAIDGIMEKLDPYSNYIKPEELSSFKSSVESEFGGIGIQVGQDGGQLRVISPIVGTPAYRAGLKAGDRILKIGEESTAGMPIDTVVRRLKGTPGTSVELTVQRTGESAPSTVPLTREIIHVETVLGDRRQPDDSWNFFFDEPKKIGYVRLTAFSRETAKELKDALEQLRSGGVKGLVLDVRFNPGGLLSAAIETSDLLLSDGVIVSTAGRNTEKRVWNARKAGTFDGFPVAVLVNRFSASASEILSGCLQDHQRAIVVGERTWGKGSVQNVIDLDGGKSALKLTTAGYMRPSGKNIHRFPGAKETDEWGVLPNPGFEIRLSEEEQGRLVQFRRERDVVKSRGARPAPPEPASDADEPFVDRQLQKALEYLDQELARAN